MRLTIAIAIAIAKRKQQSLRLLTATSDIMKILRFLRKILRYFNLFLHVNQIAKYVVKRSVKSP